MESLAAQHGLEAASVEVILVDNNSDDSTPAVARSFVDRLPLVYVREERQGLSHARNRGVAESRGEVVLFTDDDVRLDESWLASYLEAFEAHREAGFFGGRIVPDWDGRQRPKWLRDEAMPLLSGVLLAFDYGTETRPYREGDQGPVGASFAVRRRLFSRLAPFRPDLGVVGNQPGRAEETEFLERARRQGERGVYVGKALCRHRVDPRRLALRALYRHGMAKGRAEAGARVGGARLRAGWFLIRGLFQLLRGHGDRFRQCVINAGIEIGRARLRSSGPA